MGRTDLRAMTFDYLSAADPLAASLQDQTGRLQDTVSVSRINSAVAGA